MKLSIHTALAAIAAALSIQPTEVRAGDGNLDSRVREALAEAEIRYSTDDDGDVKAAFRTEDNRTQLVFVSNDTEKLLNYEYRKVYSVAYVGAPLNEECLEQLLVENDEMLAGGWKISKNERRLVVFFEVAIPADADGPTIKTAIQLCVDTADKKEKELTGNDKL